MSIDELTHRCDECGQERPYLVRVSYREIVDNNHHGEYAPRMARYDWCLGCLNDKIDDALLAPELP